MVLAQRLAILVTLAVFGSVAGCGDDDRSVVDSGLDAGTPMDGSRPDAPATDAGRDAPATPDGGGVDGAATDAGADAGGCVTNDDCPSGVCILLVCRPAACTDGIQNGEESDTDCGGSECAGCDTGQSCTAAEDCASRICDATDGTCSPPSCDDGIINQDETDVDCGGRACPDRCDETEMCAVGGDCTTGSCSSGECQPPACDDGVRNGSETDVDCGGPVAAGCPRCAEFRRCAANRDCGTPPCTMGYCGSNPCIPFGTDTFGYTGCKFTPASSLCPDIRATGMGTSLDDYDEVTVPIGFSFDFYGAPYTNVIIESNGALGFDASGFTLSDFNSCLPDTFDLESYVAVFWDDLDPGATGSDVYYQLVGSAPSRQLVVTWETERYGAGSDQGVFTAVLEEGSNDIHICYTDTTFGDAAYDDGSSATAGIQGSDTDHLEMSCNTAGITDGLYARYIHP